MRIFLTFFTIFVVFSVNFIKNDCYLRDVTTFIFLFSIFVFFEVCISFFVLFSILLRFFDHQRDKSSVYYPFKIF